MRAPFGDPYDEEEQDPDPEAQRAALDAIMAPAPAPAVAPPKPMGYPDGADQGSLERAQSRDRRADFSDALSSALTRTPMRGGHHEEQDRVGALRTGADQAEALQGRQAAMAKNAERADPNSQSSRNTRAFFKAVDPQTVAQIGPLFERMSHAEVMEKFPYLQHLMLARARQTAKVEKPLSAPPIANIKMQSELDEEEQRARIAKLERVPVARTAAGPKPEDPIRREQLELRKHKQAVLENQNDAVGFEDINPAQHKYLQGPQAAALADQKSARDRVKDTTERLLGLYNENPKAFPASVAMAQMKALASELYPLAASAGGYGQLTTGHQHLLTDAVGDPAIMQNYINSGRFPAVLQELLHGTENALAQKAAALGKKESKAGVAGTPTKPPPWPGAIRVKDSKGGMGWLHPDEAIPPGFVEVPSG